MQRMPCLLRARGFSIRIRLFSWTDPKNGAAFLFLKAAGFDVKTTLFADTASNVRWLLTQAKDDPPNVFIANHVVPALHAAKYFRRWGVPTIGIIRSDDAFYRAIGKVFLNGAKASRVSAFVCVSSWMSEYLMSTNIGSTIITRIPSGTPLPASFVAPPTSAFRITYVGRFVEEQKRVSEVTLAFCRAVTEISGVEAFLIGEGPSRVSIDNIILNHGTEKVQILGHMSASAVQKHLLESHVIVLMSDYEGTPTAIMEGMACGCVPVCLDIRSGIPELVVHGSTGLIIDDRGDSFISAIKRLKANPDLWLNLSRSARAHIQNGFTVDWAAKEWTKLLASLGASVKVDAKKVPASLVFPKVHPDLAHQDIRGPSFIPLLLFRLKRARFYAGRLKQIFKIKINSHILSLFAIL